MLDWAHNHTRGKVEHLPPSTLADVRFEERPQRRLAGMSFEGRDLGFKIVANLDGRGDRRQSDRLTIGQRKVCAA